MSLSGKTQAWVDAGLITGDQREKILAHEQGRSAFKWKAGVVFAGLFSILLGVALIIAANWQDISPAAKLGVHFALNAVLAALVWCWRNDPARRTHGEIALFALWGLTLTLIALIGQIFQLGGEAYEAVRFWFWLTTPMILLLARGAYIARLWALAFIVYVPYDLVAATWDATQDWNIRKGVLLGTAVLVPFGAWGLSVWPRFAAARPEFAASLRRLGVLLALFSASMAGTEYYHPVAFDYSLLIPAAFAGLAVALRFALQRLPHLTPDQRGDIDIMALAGLFSVAPFLAPVQGEAMALVHFLAFWLLAGTVWQQHGHARAVSLAIAIITLRLFIGFLELFGSMMMSGLGFIAVGVVLIALVWGARRLDKKLKGAA